MHGEMMKEEALKLADELQKHFNCYNEYSDMIRRLVEELDALNAKESMWQEMIEDLECQVIKYKQGEPFHDFNTLTLDTGEKRSLKPLSDDEIWELHQEHIDEIPCGHSMKTIGFVEFARAIEERHGIK